VHQSNVENGAGKCTWEELWLYVYLNFVLGYFMMLLTLIWLCTD